MSALADELLADLEGLSEGEEDEQQEEQEQPQAGPSTSNGVKRKAPDDEDEENPSAAPAKLISKENSRQPYLKTILNPEQESPAATSYRPPRCMPPQQPRREKKCG